MKNFLGILLVFPWIFCGSAGAVDVVDLTGQTGWLPYEAETFPHFRFNRSDNPNMGPSGILFDIDGDGYKDLIRSRTTYVFGVGHTRGMAVTYYQTNLPPRFCRKDVPAFGLIGDLDLDGDGQPEMVVTGRTPDQSLWRFWIMDPKSGEIENSFDLPGGRDVRPDGVWDGAYRVIGTLNCGTAGRDRTALVVCVNVAFDLEGRGVLAVDPYSGEILWRYVTGPNPLGFTCRVTDLDQDGKQEVVFLGRAPDNLDGRKINGFSDDESRLFVLDNQGNPLWTRRVSGWYGGGFLTIADLDGDGNREIITSAYTTPVVWGEVVVWSHDGHSLARYTSDSEYRNVVLLPGEEGHDPRLAVASKIGKIQILEFAPPDLRLTTEIKTTGLPFINCVADILPPAGRELVFSIQDGTIWVLDRDFQPLARHNGNPRTFHSPRIPWRISPDLELLMSERGPGFPLVFAKAPPPPVNQALIASLAAAALLLAAGFLYWKKGRNIPPGDPAMMREIRLNLLEDLELSSHGAIAPLKCVRRLCWHLNAMTSGLGDNPNLEVRLRETWTECRENALPHMAGILDRARLAGLSGVNIDHAAKALGKIGLLLDELEKEQFQVKCFPVVAARLTVDLAQTDDDLKDLRTEVAGFFRTDLAATVTRILRANAQALEEGAVTVQTGALARMAAGGEADTFSSVANLRTTCLIDPREMDFVLDNLVGNAVRAMKDAPQRNLSVTWTTADGMVMVDVRDTGCGIPHENRDRILDTHFSTRQGGGDGLPRSRRILRKYGGSLMILETATDRGTTFRVTIPAV